MRKLYLFLALAVLLMALGLLSGCHKNPTGPEDQVEAPVFNPPGGSYLSVQMVGLSCASPGAQIRYTTDGSTPDKWSPLYSVPIQISYDLTLKARAFKAGKSPSPVSTAVYNVNPSVATPSLSPPPGVYNTVQMVTVSCITEGAFLFYTLDGSEPDFDSTLYTEPIYIPNSATLKVRGFRNGLSPSPVATGIYTFNFDQSSATPQIYPPGGTYSAVQEVELYCATPGAVIRYSTDGTEPTSESRLYNHPVTISSVTTLKARSFRDGMMPSGIATAMYVVILDPIEMVSVPAGTFYMGNTLDFGDDDEHPVHLVTLNAFSIGKYEITQKQWTDVMDTYPIMNSGTGPDRPVYNVSWYEILKFCNLRSMADGLTPAYYIRNSTDPTDWGEVPYDNNGDWNDVFCNWSANGYFMPTEAEWEYAARGAADNPNYEFSGSNNINDVAWYASNSGYECHPVGELPANSLGIHDMTGNVAELSWDSYTHGYPSGHLNNPHSSSGSNLKVIRGGHFYGSADDCRLANRDHDMTYDHGGAVGFRVRRRL